MTPTFVDDPRTLVSTDWLAAHLKDPDLRVIDASWYLPDAGRDAKSEYAACHIPGARFFDIDAITDQRSALPHMAPPPEKFISRMRAMGIGDGHQVVVYDGAGLFSAARVWWTFRLMGKLDVAVVEVAGVLPDGRELRLGSPRFCSVDDLVLAVNARLAYARKKPEDYDSELAGLGLSFDKSAPGSVVMHEVRSPTGGLLGISDLRDEGNKCRFANCQHKREPDCAVKNGLEDGTLSPARYELYQMLKAELEEAQSQY